MYINCAALAEYYMRKTMRRSKGGPLLATSDYIPYPFIFLPFQ